MSIEIYVADEKNANVTRVNKQGERIVPTLGAEDKSVAVQLQELFDSVTKSVSGSIEIESELMIEITGSITLKADASSKWLIFNIGGETTTSGTMKVALKTKLKPTININAKQ